MTRYRLGILVVPALLAGCAQPQPQVVVAAPIGRSVPDGLLTCLPEPSGAAVRSDVDASRYVTSLARAGRDCRRKLGAARTLLKGER